MSVMIMSSTVHVPTDALRTVSLHYPHNLHFNVAVRLQVGGDLIGVMFQQGSEGESLMGAGETPTVKRGLQRSFQELNNYSN